MNGPSVIDMWLHCIPIPMFQSPKCNSHSPPPFPFQLPRTRRHFFSQTANSNSAIRYSSKKTSIKKMHALDPPSPTTTLESCPHPLGRVCNKIIQYSCQRLLVLLVSVITCRLQKKMESGKQPTAAGPQRLQVSMHVRRACLPQSSFCDDATLRRSNMSGVGCGMCPCSGLGPPPLTSR